MDDCTKENIRNRGSEEMSEWDMSEIETVLAQMTNGKFSGENRITNERIKMGINMITKKVGRLLNKWQKK